jgi:hypothetical protein
MRKNMGLEYQPTATERHGTYPGDPKAYGTGEQNTMSAGQTQAAQPTAQAATPANQLTDQATQSTQQKIQASPESSSSTSTTLQDSAAVRSASDGITNLSKSAQRPPTVDELSQRIRKERNDPFSKK